MANVSSNNLTTLYSGGGVNVRPTSAYGNANVVSLLNVGTDGGNTVTNIIASGNLTTGGEINSAGNITAPWFLGNVIGNISGNIVVPGSNTAVLYNNNGNAGASDNLKFNFSSNVLTANGNIVANYFIGNGSGLSSLTGANVTGAVAYATTANSVAGANVTGQVGYAAVANSVAVANVSGIGNIAVINLDGNASNILFGNGIFAAGGGGNAANANYANFAGNVTNSAQPNITSVGTLSNLSVSGNITSGNANLGNLVLANYFSGDGSLLSNINGSNVSNVANANYASFANVASSANSVALANVSGIGNIANINLDGSSSNVLFGNGVFATITIPSGNGISNGTSNVSIPVANGNVNTSVGGTPNVFVVTTTGANVAGYVNATGNITGNALQLITSPGTLTPATGQMVWDTASNTVSLGMLNGVTQQIGLESYVLVKASATITDGQVVMFTGANGNHVTAAPADTASVGFRAEYIIGVATQSIATNDFGYITVLGIVHGLNTNAFNVGDILWVDNSTPGALTATRPSDPNFQIEVAAVTKKSSGDGHLQVRVTAFNSIDQLTDVTITTPANGQSLVYSGNVWVNGTANVANTANYANFAGTLINGNSNVNITTNANINMNVSGNANVVQVDGNGSIWINPIAGGYNNMIRLLNYGISGGAGASRISSFRYRGNAAANLSVQPNDSTIDIVTLGYNGSILQSSSLARIRANVDASYTANGANIPLGWQIVVNDTNGGINNQAKTHNFYSNGNVAFANSVSIPNELSVTGNANVTGNVTVTANISGGNANLGNLVIANYFSGSGNLLSNINGSNVSNVANANYANFAGTLINGTSNINITTNANINMNVSGNANVVQIDGNGSIFTTPLAGGYTNWLRINNYGTTANGNGALASRISSFRYRGNISANLSVEPNDGTLELLTGAYNGTTLQTNSLARVRATVDSSYVANGANIPIGWQILVNDTNGGINNQTKTHNFYSNGNVAFANSMTAVGNIQGANVRATALFRGLGNTFLGDSANVAATNHQLFGNTNLTGNVFVGGGVANGSSLIMNYGNNGIQVLDGNIQVQNANGNGGYLTGTYVRSYDSLEIRALAQPANIAMYSANGAIIAVGNITGGNANLGNLATANYFSGNLTGNTSIANLSLTKFQETVVSGGTVSGTLTPNSTAGTIYNYTLNGNITINALGNVVSGTSMTLILTQDGTGNRVLTSSMKFAGGLKTLSTAASATDIMSVFYDGTTYYATLSRGFV